MEKEKRMAGDYEITAAMHIGDKELVIGENLADKNTPFMVACCERNELLIRYYDVRVSDSYAEIVKLYGERISEQAELVLQEEKALEIPLSVISAEDCIPDDYHKSINGKIVAVNPDVLRNEYRRADRQLYLVTGGFGAEATPVAVLCFVPICIQLSIHDMNAGIF